MGLQNRKRDKKHKIGAVIICPEHFPHAKHVVEREFALKGNEDPSACVVVVVRYADIIKSIR